jgi:maltooligosyltrehalose synthase
MTVLPSVRINLNAALGVTFETVIAMLWFIKAMGFRRIYLSCVLQNPRPKQGDDPRADCGYGPNSWEIDPRLGGAAALVDLCLGAQKEGLQVCLDLVHHMNPEGNIWWQDIELRPKFFCWDPNVGPDGVGMNYAGFDHLQALNITDPAVATSFYRSLIELYRRGLLTGFLRIDFPDGIGDPHAYARWLKQTFPGLPILFECTRPPGHALPEGVVGTTGGDTIRDLFLACANQAGLTALVEEGVRQTGCALTFQDHMTEVIRDRMKQPWFHWHERLLQHLRRLPGAPDVSLEAIVEGLLSLPDRAWPDLATRTLTDYDRELIERSNLPEGLCDILLLKGNTSFNPWIELWWRTVANLRCLAFRIACGRDLRLPLTHEGGIGPDACAIDGRELHRRVLDRIARAAGTLITDNSHDRRFGPIQAAFTAALTHHADLFLQYLQRWQGMNAHLGSADVPGREFAWLAYQTLAVLPITSRAGRKHLFDLAAVQDFLVRTAREHGVRTAWWPPEKVNRTYEQAVLDWLVALDGNETFVDSLAEFQDSIRDTAMNIAFGWILMRLTGQPHFELTCLNGESLLPDPHNRRRVDVAPLEANVRAFETGTPPSNETAYQWLIWLVNNLVAVRNDMDYTLVTADGGNLAFRVGGNIHVSVPLTPLGLQQVSPHVAPEDDDGWCDLLKPLRPLHPAYQRLGLYVKKED